MIKALAATVRYHGKRNQAARRATGGTVSETPKPELLSTSKLGAAMGLPNAAATLERLRAVGYLELVDDSDRLTEKGKEGGGRSSRRADLNRTSLGQRV